MNAEQLKIFSVFSKDGTLTAAFQRICDTTAKLKTVITNGLKTLQKSKKCYELIKTTSTKLQEDELMIFKSLLQKMKAADEEEELISWGAALSTYHQIMEEKSKLKLLALSVMKGLHTHTARTMQIKIMPGKITHDVAECGEGAVNTAVSYFKTSQYVELNTHMEKKSGIINFDLIFHKSVHFSIKNILRKLFFRKGNHRKKIKS